MRDSYMALKKIDQLFKYTANGVHLFSQLYGTPCNANVNPSTIIQWFRIGYVKSYFETGNRSSAAGIACVYIPFSDVRLVQTLLTTLCRSSFHVTKGLYNRVQGISEVKMFGGG